MKLRAVAIVLAALLCEVPGAQAGITIHYEGQAEGAAGVERMGLAVCAKAKQFGWPCKPIAGHDIRQADRITGEFVTELEGSSDLSNASGVVVHPAPMSEPVYLVAGPSGKLKNFVKTQFAGADIHVKVVELLEVAKAQLANLEVEDDSDFAETKDRQALERAIANVDAMLAKALRDEPGVRGPVRLPNGRILDLVQGR